MWQVQGFFWQTLVWAVSKFLGASTQSLFTFSCLRKPPLWQQLAMHTQAQLPLEMLYTALLCLVVLRVAVASCPSVYFGLPIGSVVTVTAIVTRGSLNPVVTFGSLVTASTLLGVTTFSVLESLCLSLSLYIYIYVYVSAWFRHVHPHQIVR